MEINSYLGLKKKEKEKPSHSKRQRAGVYERKAIQRIAE